jgi:hypothetical protein
MPQRDHLACHHTNRRHHDPHSVGIWPANPLPPFWLSKSRMGSRAGSLGSLAVPELQKRVVATTQTRKQTRIEWFLSWWACSNRTRRSTAQFPRLIQRLNYRIKLPELLSILGRHVWQAEKHLSPSSLRQLALMHVMRTSASGT